MSFTMIQSDLGSIIEALHHSGINGGVTWFYHRAWHVEIGDPVNGRKAAASLSSLSAAVEWLRAMAIEIFPDSEFAKAHRAQLSTARPAAR